MKRTFVPVLAIAMSCLFAFWAHAQDGGTPPQKPSNKQMCPRGVTVQIVTGPQSNGCKYTCGGVGAKKTMPMGTACKSPSGEEGQCRAQVCVTPSDLKSLALINDEFKCAGNTPITVPSGSCQFRCISEHETDIQSDSVRIVSLPKGTSCKEGRPERQWDGVCMDGRCVPSSMP